METSPQQFICPRIYIKDIKEDNPCEIQLLDVKNTSACEKTLIQISSAAIKQFGDINQWIGSLPKLEILKLKCKKQGKVQKPTAGTYLIDVPIGCQLSSHIISDLDVKFGEVSPNNITVRLDDIELEYLKSIRTHIIEKQPKLFYETTSYMPSFWTMALYGLLILGIIYFLYEKIYPKLRMLKRNQPQNVKEDIDFTDVQLPR